jgi:TorA maturation chaperone TorD
LNGHPVNGNWENNAPISLSDVWLLSRLWLNEPDADLLTTATRRLGLPAADPAELAAAYTDLFLLNVYPYGTVFTSASGELNGPEAQHLAVLYEANGYQPANLSEIGAPDHLGACLGFAAHLGERGTEIGDFATALVEWGPVCCLAVERELPAHPFYQAVAKLTREWLLGAYRWVAYTPQSDELPPISLSDSADDEISLRDLVRFFLAPARCGVFLSRARLGQMAKSFGMRLPFGSRFEVAETLLLSAGEAGQIVPLLAALGAEIKIWQAEYLRWGEAQPNWKSAAERWLARTSKAMAQLADMQRLVEEKEA